jgi:RNA polymerase sigma-70 factor (ECF subfamily)
MLQHTQLASDEEVVAIYRDGESKLEKEQAADELFRRHQGRVTRWCYRFTRDREAALDLAQEILLRAFRNIAGYRGDCRFSTWLYAITRNSCMSALHKRANEPVWTAKALTVEIPDPSAGNIHAVVERAESRQKSWDFIRDTLDHTETRVMLLHYGNEMPLDAVSRMLGLTNKSGAKAYIVSARRKLTAALGAAAGVKEAAPLAGGRASISVRSSAREIPTAC